MTCPELFAVSHGNASRTGTHRCFFCGAMCSGENAAKQYVKDSFTGIDTVACQTSPAICDGCVMCLDEDRVITTHDGNRRTGQRVRGYSWVLSGRGAIACTKADREFLRAECCNPPDPPFALCISDSGQKHLLYRGVVCHSREHVTATLEVQRIDYRPTDLIERITMCIELIAATGKPALQEGLSRMQRMLIVDSLGDDLLRRWDAAAGEPLTALAIWLSPGKEGATHERERNRSAGHSVVPAETGGAD